MINYVEGVCLLNLGLENDDKIKLKKGKSILEEIIHKNQD